MIGLNFEILFFRTFPTDSEAFFRQFKSGFFSSFIGVGTEMIKISAILRSLISEVNSMSVNFFRSPSSVSFVESIPFFRSLILSLFRSKPITFLF